MADIDLVMAVYVGIYAVAATAAVVHLVAGSVLLAAASAFAAVSVFGVMVSRQSRKTGGDDT